ncbi:MAG: PIN domain-containing protein [Tetrasphaera sp.]
MTAGSPVALDTSVAIPLLVASHEAHAAVASWATGRSFAMGVQALAETYAVLTRLPGDARVAPDDAVVLIDDNIINHLDLPGEVTARLHRELAGVGVSGAATYDGLVALAAREHDLLLATRDARARPTYEAIGVRVEIVTG